MRANIFARPVVAMIILIAQASAVFGQHEIAKAAMEQSALPERGTVVLSGGLAPTADVIELMRKVGGEELVYIPTADGDFGAAEETRIRAIWKDRGFVGIDFLHASSREEVESPKFVDVLKQKKAVFICGGKQVRLGERYTKSPVPGALRELLDRGGIVVGSSAGTAILPRPAIYDEQCSTTDGTEIRNVIEGSGFGLVPCLVDTHFKQRRRTWRIEEMQRRHPDWCGFGVDEKTSLVFEFDTNGIRVSVLGEQEVDFHHAPSSLVPGAETKSVLKKGGEQIVLKLVR